MKKKAEDIAKEFFRAIFGRFIADILFRQMLDKFHIGDFESLDTIQKIKIGQKIIEDVFTKFYTEEKIENMKVLYLLRFSLNEVGGKVEEITKKECQIKINSPEEIPPMEIDTHIRFFEQEGNIKFIFEWSEMLEGHLLITLSKDTSIRFAGIFMQAMMGISPEGDELDEMKVSAMNEFFNIILPVFSKVIGDSFKQMLFFTPTTYNDFKTKYFLYDEFIKPQKIIHSKINFRLDNVEHNGELFFFIKEATGRFKKLLDLAQLKKDPFEEAPPRIFAKSTGNIREDVDNFFDMLNLPRENIDYILKKIYKHSLNNFEYYDYIKFYQTLITEFLTSSSENKKEVIKINLAYLLGLKKETK
ncbi:hypothetical protein JXB31_01185 [Candidatus Woesearchaeota archaeon]|nr:hypothetical protein [Candidatus Woesearchaeota archaeon]